LGEKEHHTTIYKTKKTMTTINEKEQQANKERAACLTVLLQEDLSNPSAEVTSSERVLSRSGKRVHRIIANIDGINYHAEAEYYEDALRNIKEMYRYYVTQQHEHPDFLKMFGDICRPQNCYNPYK
jgi:hypothetical protein